jgi:hypothetical protein
MPATTLSKTQYRDCIALRHKYECVPGAADAVAYQLKEPWASNGVDAVAKPRCYSLKPDLAATTRRIRGETGLTGSARTMILATKTACEIAANPKHDSYARYLLRKKQCTA